MNLTWNAHGAGQQGMSNFHFMPHFNFTLNKKQNPVVHIHTKHLKHLVQDFMVYCEIKHRP